MEFQKLQLKKFAPVQERETSEAKFWKTFLITSEEKLQSSPNCIHFNPLGASPGAAVPGATSFLVSNSTKVILYDGMSDKAQRAYSRFDDDAFSGRFRKDGKLVVAGDRTGFVKVFDVETKGLLRTIKGHTDAVRTTKWTCDGLHILSGSDDKKAKYFDLATEEQIWSSKSTHSDYVRSVDTNPADPNLFVTSSYDHSVCLWDVRQKEPHTVIPTGGFPVESVLYASRNGCLLATAAGPEIKIWDLLSGGRLMHSFLSHQKNVTDLCLDGTGCRLLSCGLDGNVKVHNLLTLETIHGMRFGSPLSALALSTDNEKLVVGMVNGGLVVRRRRATEGVSVGGRGKGRSSNGKLYEDPLREGGGGILGGNQQEDDEEFERAEDMDEFDHMFNESEKDSAPSSSSSSSSSSIIKLGQKPIGGRAKSLKSSSSASTSLTEDTLFETQRRDRLRDYERDLKRFAYGAALDSALASRNPLIVVTILDELSRRNGLTAALSRRDEVTLEPLFSFITRYITNPKYSKLIIQVADHMLDIYGGKLGQSEMIDELFVKLRKQVISELKLQRQIMHVMGALDGVISSSLTS